MKKRRRKGWDFRVKVVEERDWALHTLRARRVDVDFFRDAGFGFDFSDPRLTDFAGSRLMEF